MKHHLDTVAIQTEDIKNTGKMMIELKQDILDKVTRKIENFSQ